MESGNVVAPRQGVFVSVLDSSDDFESSILTRLRSAYFHQESLQSFRYESAVLIKNAALEEKYKAFRARKKRQGYSNEELEETYGFLLFDDINKARALGETGVLTGNSSCTTLGDPSKGVYLSMFSDFLDLGPWHHRQSGHIAIIRLTKGRFKKVSQNYTKNFTRPTVGFDCHMCKEFFSVSAKRRSFLTFESTQYYIYELLGDGSLETAQSPSAVCPFALVSFSYMDSNDTQEATPYEGLANKSVFHYVSWRGHLQIGPQVYSVGLKSVAGALIPTKLPLVLKLDKAITLLDLKPLLPTAAFETGFSSEVCLDGLYLSVFELVLLEAEKSKSFSLFLQELNKKQLALPVPLIDGGFLILFNCSNPLTNDDTCLNACELQAMFVFPDSRTMDGGTKCGPRQTTISSEILPALPMLHYAEGEVLKTNLDSREELSDVLMKHMQDYVLLKTSRTESSPSREDGISVGQYDVLPNHKLLYSSPELTNKSWQSLVSYLNKPVSFQLPLCKASEILADEHKVKMKNAADVTIASSIKEACEGHEDGLTSAKKAVTIPPSKDSVMPTTDVHSQFLPALVKSDYTNSEQTDAMGEKIPLIPTTSDDLSAELIVRITSAEQAVPDGSLNLVRTMTVTKHDDFSTSGLSRTKLLTAGLNDQTVDVNGTDTPDANNVTEAKQIELRARHSKGMKKPTGTSKDNTSVGVKSEQEEKSPEYLKPPSTMWRKYRKRKSMFEKLALKKKKMSASGDMTVAVDKQSDSGIHNLIKEQETLCLRKKGERWDLKPVISECGRVLVPHGSLQIADRILSLKCHPESKCNPDEIMVETPSDGIFKIQQESSTETSRDGTQNEVCPEADSPLNKEKKVVTQQDTGSSIANEESSTEMAKLGVHEKNTRVLSERKFSSSNTLFHKLKAVLSGGRRKNAAGMSTCIEKNTQPNLRKRDGKMEDTEACNSTTEKDRVTPSVDPLFAHALGLTPTEKPTNGQVLEGQDCQQSPNSPEIQGETIPHEEPGKDPLKPRLGRHRRTKMKTQKKHQRISTDCVKKKWWLRVKTPSGNQSKNCSQKKGDGDMSVVKTVGRKKNNTRSSADALDLLADLALSVGSDLLNPSPKRRGRRRSVLYALLKQASKPVEDPDSSDRLMEEKERVALLVKEHNYSSPQSSAQLSSSQSPLQVPPLSGSTSLMHRHQQLHSNKDETLRPSVCQDDRHQHDYCYNSPEKHKFRIYRRFIRKAESVQVTREWENNYDFSGDWQLMSDPKSKAIMRGLHGPCRVPFKDVVKDVRLIVNMWIGLFYSRSMPRIFDMDCDVTNQCPVEGALEMSKENPSGPDKSKLQMDDIEASSTPLDLVSEMANNLVSETLHSDRNDPSDLEESYEVLDLSLRDSSRIMKTPDLDIKDEKPTVSAENENNPLKANSPDNINQMNDFNSCCEETETPGPIEMDTTVEGEDKIQQKDEKNCALGKAISRPSSKDVVSNSSCDHSFSIGDDNWQPTGLVTDAGSEYVHKPEEEDEDLKEDELNKNHIYILVEEKQDNESEQPEPTNNFTEEIVNEVDEIVNEESYGVMILKDDANKYSHMGDHEDSKLGETSGTDDHDITETHAYQTEEANESPVLENPSQLNVEAHNPLDESGVTESTTCMDDRLEEETKTNVLLVHDVSEMFSITPPIEDALPFPGTLVTCLQEKIQEGQKQMRFKSETFQPDLFAVECRSPKIPGIREETQNPFIKLKKVCQPAKIGYQSDDRCPTPTLDEPCEPIPVSVPDSCTATNMGRTPNLLGSSFTATTASRSDELKLHAMSDELLKDRFDVEERTLRVLQSIKKFLPRSKRINSSQCNKTAEDKGCIDQTLNLEFKPTSIKRKRKKSKKSLSLKAVALASPSRIVPDDHFCTLPLEGNLEEAKVHSVTSEVSFLSEESKIDEEPSPHTVEPSSNLDDGDVQQPSNNKPTNVPCPSVPTTSSEETEHVLGQIDSCGHDKPEALKSSVSQDINDSNSHLDDTNLERKDQCVEWNTTKKLQNNLKQWSETIAFENKDDDLIKSESLTMEPHTSLVCTVFNNGDRKSSSFLEKVSKRCLPSNPTQASMEQESLIFSEGMKQLFKRFSRVASSQEGTQEKSLSCTSPMTVNFSNLKEQDDSLDLLVAPLPPGTKIKVDTSDRENSLDTTKGEKSCSQLTSPGSEGSNKFDKVSDLTSKFAKLYKAMMDEACNPVIPPTTPENLSMDRSPNKTEPSDSLDQIKQDMEKMFRIHLNQVVKKSCKTKYRFYILVTSDDDIFGETKAQLEAAGHTAVQPSEFFVDQKSSSPLLIILRNEDIAEHISRVPHLLELKKTPCVQFAGIDEPDDVVNLTHQELFTRGGFIMFDRAALENLTLCNMEKCSEILHDLRKTGKWKWMYHYRDSRRLKENARTNAEAKQKKSFLNICEDEGILEVLPYHACDVTSRDQSDYLTCLVRLQVHNISARYPVFITDTTTDTAFGRNGIFTVTLDNFLTNFSIKDLNSDQEEMKR